MKRSRCSVGVLPPARASIKAPSLRGRFLRAHRLRPALGWIGRARVVEQSPIGYHGARPRRVLHLSRMFAALAALLAGGGVLIAMYSARSFAVGAWVTG